jgi:hypothetical protein
MHQHNTMQSYLLQQRFNIAELLLMLQLLTYKQCFQFSHVVVVTTATAIVICCSCNYMCITTIITLVSSSSSGVYINSSSWYKCMYETVFL